MWLKILLALNAIGGLSLLAYAYKVTAKLRVAVEERDSKYPAWRRYDTNKFNLIKEIPVAATILLPRVFLSLGCWVLLFIMTKFIMIGADIKKGVPQSRRRFIKYSFSFVSWLMHLFSQVVPEPIELDVDYSEYLGPDYVKNYKVPEGRVSTYVSNHVSGFDMVAITEMVNGDIAAVAGAFLKGMPIFDWTCRVTESLFAPRGGTPEAKQATVDLIVERQKGIESGKLKLSPLCIYPEGTVTNNTQIQEFKRGAFTSGCAVMPIFLKYECPQIHVSTTLVHDFISLVFMCVCIRPTICKGHFFPTFQPTEYMYTKYADKGADRPEIYAWVVRDMMCKAMKVEKCEMHFADKKKYLKEMGQSTY